VTSDWRLPICALVSVAGHLVFANGLRRLPRHEDRPPIRKVSIRVIAPPPSPEPPPEPVRPPEAPPKVAHERPRARAPSNRTEAAPPKTVPPPEQPPPPTATGDAPPVFGVSMESTSRAGSGPAMPTGNTPRPTQTPRTDGEARGAAVIPVPAYQVTTMPLPQGRCQGRYTEDAKLAAIEGTVVLDLIVDEHGRVRDVQVVSGLGHGLTEAAIAAVKQCHFSPGEKEGTPVPVRVRGFKIRFLMQDAE
jgi:protein TonB